ncbi:MAG: hypothetical protein M3Q50_05035 [Chloroflexota bacterium]|nr:hypothetical protein [Chloroflexia bacterium]MDQ3225979.1 hypothetical protein [Chloroflexota bacterium]
MEFDWDPAQNASNQRKHGYDLDDAKAVFLMTPQGWDGSAAILRTMKNAL